MWNPNEADAAEMQLWVLWRMRMNRTEQHSEPTDEMPLLSPIAAEYSPDRPGRSPLSEPYLDQQEWSRARSPLPASSEPFDSGPPPPNPETGAESLKREADEHEAGPSNVKKVDHTNDNDCSCECCVQQLLRTDQLNQQIARLELEAQQARSDVMDKMVNYEIKKEVLRSILGTEIASKLLEEFIEKMPSFTESDVGFLPAAARPRQSNGSADIIMLLDLITKVASVASASGPSEAELSLASSSGNGFSRFLLGSRAGGDATPAPSDPSPHPAPPALAHFAPTSHMANSPCPGADLNQPLRPPMLPKQPQNSPYFAEGSYPNQQYYHPYQ